MASTLLPIRAWEAKKILSSDEVYERAGDQLPTFSVSNTPSDRSHLCDRESNNTGGRMRLTMMIYWE
jgi:hypothetical protein